MEAGSKKKDFNNQDFISGRGILVFLSWMILLLINFLTRIFTLISLSDKGIQKSVFIGLVFLFSCVSRPASGLMTAFSHHITNSVSKITNLHAGCASNAMHAGNAALKSGIAILADKVFFAAHSFESLLNETPGFSTAEAPSSQLAYSGIIASTSCMLNQFRCL